MIEKRYEVTALHDGGERKAFGRTNHLVVVEQLCDAIRRSATMRDPKVIDRLAPTPEELEEYEPLARMLSQ